MRANRIRNCKPRAIMRRRYIIAKESGHRANRCLTFMSHKSGRRRYAEGREAPPRLDLEATYGVRCDSLLWGKSPDLGQRVPGREALLPGAGGARTAGTGPARSRASAGATVAAKSCKPPGIAARSPQWGSFRRNSPSTFFFLFFSCKKYCGYKN